MANDVHGAGQMNRQWDLAIGAGALLSGIALYAITIAAVPTTIVFGTEVPVACVYGSSSQACADATARFAIMKQIQPISLFVAGFGGVLMVYGALQKTDPFDQRILALESEEESRSSGSRAGCIRQSPSFSVPRFSGWRWHLRALGPTHPHACCSSDRSRICRSSGPR